MSRRDISAESFSAHTSVLIIAINDYAYSDFASLGGPTHNAVRLKAALTDGEGCAIPESKVKVFPERASSSEIVSSIRTVAAQARTDDLLVVYFCGHGVVENDQFYLCLKDSSRSNLNDTGVSGTDLDDALHGSSARGVLLILDCCRAGSLPRYAPALFRDARQGDFRILMSSSGSDEASWDLGKDGTLFSRYLITAIEGTEPIKVSGPGLIYLSDLLKFIQSGIQEYQESAHSDLSQQMPRLVGFHSIDPLLFVHRRLTFAQISLKAVRYSGEYVRQRTRRLALVAATLCAFLLGTFYAFLEHHQFVRTESSVLVLYEGEPGIRLFDLPRRLRVLDLVPAEMPDRSPLRHEGGAVIGRLGANVEPLVFGDVRPEFAWYAQSLRGNLDDAFLKLKEALIQGFEPPSPALAVAEIVVQDKASPVDTQELRQIASSANRRISYLGWLGLAKNGIMPGPQDIVRFSGNDSFLLGKLVTSLRGTCTPPIKDFLTAAVGGASTAIFGRAYSEGILAMVTLNCKFTAQELAALRLTTAFRPFAGGFRDDDLSVFSFLTDADGFRAEMINFLQQQDIASIDADLQRKIITVLAALQVDPERVCPKNLDRFLGVAGIRVPAAYLLLRNCGQNEDFLRQPQYQTGPNVVDLVRVGAMTEDDLLRILKSPNDFWTISSALRSVRLLKTVVKPQELVAAILPLLHFDDQTQMVQSTAIAALTFLHYQGDAILPLTKTDSYLAADAFWWMRQARPNDVRPLLFNNIQALRGTASAEFLASETPLTKDERIRLDNLLEGNEGEQQNAACLLAIYGDVDEQLEALHAADPYIRGIASRCAVYNSQFEHLISRLGNSDALTVATLRLQHSYVKIFAQRIQELPHWARKWAVLLFASGPQTMAAPRLAFGVDLGPAFWWMDDT